MPFPAHAPLRHIVLFAFQPTASADQIAAVITAFTQLPLQIADILHFELGENISPEALNDGYTHAFTLSFASAEACNRYIAHPAHQAFVALAQPFLTKALVFDYLVG
ncbi:Dabb family protein [Andreprevotia chitinilytica]|uniref:Dabb family protein n=1 Tax=Andreprevotia chitinilytica TaxID=396808 RepID=UPI0005566B3B|nr:Dabb family protein [Andreprevotia chitinilytica]